MPFDCRSDDFEPAVIDQEPVHIQVLRRAKYMIRWRWHWTKDTPACDRRGNMIDPMDPNAARFCAYGAVVRAAKDLGAQKADRSKALRLLGDDIERVNDEDGFRAVHRRFVIAMASY